MPHLERSRAGGVSRAHGERRETKVERGETIVVRRGAALGRASRASSRSASSSCSSSRSRRLDRSGGRSRPIILKSEFERRGVTASYHLDRVGLRTQEVSNLVIGDPKRPDLVARYAHHPDAAEVERQLRGLSHRRARRPAARPAGPRQGQLGPDRQAAAAAEQQAVRAARISCSTSPTARIALATPFGPLGVALEGNGKLSGGFKGRAAVVSPQLVPGPLRRDQPARQCRASRSSRAGRASTGRSRSTASPARPAGSTSPRRASTRRPASTRAFTSIDGSGRMAIATLVAGANGLANFVGDITLQGLARRRSTGG